MSTIRFEYGADHIATLILDTPGQAVNMMSAAFMADLSSAVTRLEGERDRLVGVILTSAKSTFFAGGDLRALAAVQPEDGPAFFDSIQSLKASFRRLEQLGRPVVAALGGSTLGGGLELALACHHRVGVDDPRIQIGFPEVALGLLPGAGGVTKTVRLVGLQAALPILSEGRRMKPAEALAAGLIHATVASADLLLPAARAWIAANPAPRQPWDDPKWRIPGGTPSNPAIASVLPIAPAILQQKTQGNYPAPVAIMACAVEGAQVDFETAMRIESRWLARLATGQVAKNMIGTLFFQMNELKSGASRPSGPARWKPDRVGVLGAGMMGAGIAWACASRGIPCVLKDVSLEKASAGRDVSGRLLAKRVEKGRMTVADAQAVLDRIIPTASAEDLRDCDLVIEAVFENRELKAQVTHEVEAVLSPGAIVASNTSTLPISGLARASTRPERFIGLHFFSPVDRMELVEIIKGDKTSADTLAQAFDFVQAIDKTPIVVNDSRGFYTSRVFGSFVNEGLALLGEGVLPAMIENIAMQAGMPVGPLAVLDEVSLKLADDVLHQELADLEREAAGHAHEHSAACGHDHSHGHDDSHGHAHGHSHEHGHAHDHDHKNHHAHEHEHGHGHAHEHDHAHAHEHGHAHAHEHDHAHEHEHVHAHAHEHHHEHTRTQASSHTHGHSQPGALPAAASGAKTVVRIQRHVHRMKSRRMPESAVYVLEKMSHGYKRLGRAWGAGFYDYPSDGPKTLWSGLSVFARGAKRQPSHNDIRERLLYIQSLETIRCLDEGVLESVRDANLGSIFGWGFPAWAGGSLQFVNHVGLARFTARAQELAAQYGDRFQPPESLIARARDGRTY